MSMKESEQTQILREILKWIRFAGIKEVKAILTNSLDTDQKKIAYYLSDGTRGTVEVAKIANIGSNKTVFDMWQLWLKQGLGESIPVKGGILDSNVPLIWRILVSRCHRCQRRKN